MKKKNIKGFITGHPTQTRNLLTITAMVINMLIALKLSASTQILLAYVWGILLLVPCIITCILHAREKNAEMQSMYKNQITAKDRTISSLRRKINDDKDAVTAGEEAIRQYGEFEAETQSVLLKVRAELDDHDKRSDMLWNYTKQIEIFNVLELNIYLDKFY